MPTTPFDRSRTEFPSLPAKLLAFFDFNNAAHSPDGVRIRTVQQFIKDFSPDDPNGGLQPHIVVQICQRLVRQGWLTEHSIGGTLALDNRYVCFQKNPGFSLSNPSAIRLIECGVYGFPAVYENYASSVIPLINCDNNGNQQIGTCFVGNSNYIFTALHCINPASRLALKGVSANDLKTAKFYVHPNKALDLALVEFSNSVFSGLAAIPIPTESAQILDEIIALGYPNVPGFHPTLAAEAASISGRLSVTRGRVASMPTEIFSQAELFLITARVRGGFSGGPILDTFGQAVGIVSREPAADANPGEGQRYDALGYGTAIPAQSALELREFALSGKLEPCDMTQVVFQEFE